jgi:hypothetical protein
MQENGERNDNYKEKIKMLWVWFGSGSESVLGLGLGLGLVSGSDKGRSSFCPINFSFLQKQFNIKEENIGKTI